MAERRFLCEVAVALPVFGTFTYRGPRPGQAEELIGRRVLVPFGARRVTGYVVGPGPDDLPPDADTIKDIADILDAERLFPPGMIPFFRWVADYYLHPLGEVIKTALPSGLNLYEFNAYAAAAPQDGNAARGDLDPQAQAILDCLQEGACRLKDLEARLSRPVSGKLLRDLESRGWVVRKKTLRGGRTRPKQETWVAYDEAAPAGVRLTPQRRAVLSLLAREGDLPLTAVCERAAVGTGVVRSMARCGLVRLSARSAYRDPFGDAIRPDHAPSPTGEQTAALQEIDRQRAKGFATILLEGVTGSGKTEIYLQAASTTVRRRKTVLVLVPEIALIAQMERRFRARFGDQVAVLHSGLSSGERLDQWQRILAGETPIVIGARSALFAPLENIGLIVVDEEHDGSYKQDTHLRYNARDLAVVRARSSRCPVLLGSATPSLQSFHNARAGKYVHLQLKTRVFQQSLPAVSVIDLRTIAHMRGIHKYLSPALLESVAATLTRGEQALLFLNRRGWANYPLCGQCGQALQCRNCSIAMTFHRRTNAYRCHYCGFACPAQTVCAQCGASEIQHYGLGTERLEAFLQNRFPAARVARLDRDTTRRKGHLLKVLRGLRHREIDILIGTQMVAKGHDFPDITLVGIICADTTLNFPDFRAGERTFQLLAQVSGRAGRGDKPGQVILQTYTPAHFTIAAAQQQDFRQFYREEIEYRRALAYPPFARIIQLIISGADPTQTAAAAEGLCQAAHDLAGRGAPRPASGITLLGPVPAALHRMGGRYRWQILVKGRQPGPLKRLVKQLLLDGPSPFVQHRIQVSVDVDPLFMV